MGLSEGIGFAKDEIKKSKKAKKFLNSCGELTEDKLNTALEIAGMEDDGLNQVMMIWHEGGDLFPEKVRSQILSILDKKIQALEETVIELGGTLDSDKGSCFIATATYGSYNHPTVIIYRNFRDFSLQNAIIGKFLIKFYYFVSPFIAKQIIRIKILKTISKFMLDSFSIILQKNKKF